METYIFEHDIEVLCVTAVSFPNGVLKAHQQLHALLPDIKQRRIFGISSPDQNGGIIYKAAAEILNSEEADQSGQETFVIKKGTYISILIKNFMDDVSKIGKTFEKLIKQPNIDPEGYYLEDYINETDVRCMVRIKNKKIN
ncbi:transcriptional regulator [Pedobacter chinensis]|uniref:Transcriptional regulator n=1 Tax=Pedobacter chinensis TaxID=2282421 RepID=A0A369PPR3_9SPHI|nr:transcriptional regulator [Pedobacter chinensis]RDC54524.1 transcriptional regulator [Pedobacter chinensis]